MIVRFKKPAPQFYMMLGLTGVIIAGSIWALQNNKTKNDFKTTHNPEKAKEVAENLLDTVGRIYVLPEETPTVATVTDKNTLPDNFFYRKAEVGDKLLIFANAQKIILYRPSVDKVVDVAEVEEATPTPEQEVSGAQTESTQSANIQTVPRVLYNPQSQ